MHARLGGRVEADGDNLVAQPQRDPRNKISWDQHTRADGAIGVIGAVTLVGIILAMYI